MGYFKILVVLMVILNVVSRKLHAESDIQKAFESMHKRLDEERRATPKLDLASQSIDRGKTLMSLCIACHNFNAGEPSRGPGPDVMFVGPNLFGVVGREIASLKDFRYSPALKKHSGRQWTEKDLALFLKKPERFAPGTAMKFEGVLDPQDRIDILNYLKTLK